MYLFQRREGRKWVGLDSELRIVRRIKARKKVIAEKGDFEEGITLEIKGTSSFHLHPKAETISNLTVHAQLLQKKFSTTKFYIL